MATIKQNDNKKAKVEQMLNSGVFTAAEVSLIRQYLGEKKATSKRTFGESSKHQKVSALYAFRKLSAVAFVDMSPADMFAAVNAMKEYVQPKTGKHYSPNTQNNYTKHFKAYMEWLNEGEYNKAVMPKHIKKVQPALRRKVNHTPDEILTDEEVSALIRACMNDRDRALVSTLYHSAGRVQEVLNARWCDLRADIVNGQLIGYNFTLHGTKTAETEDSTKPRELYLPRSTAELLNTLKNGTCRAESDFIFKDINRGGNQLDYEACFRVIERLQNRAQIGKHVHPHLFRTSRITNWLKEGHQETTICMLAWGTVASSMWATYVILAGGYGAEKLKAKINADLPAVPAVVAYKAPAKCIRCGNAPPEHAVFCPVCGKNLKESAGSEPVQEPETVTVSKKEWEQMQATQRAIMAKLGL